MSALPIVFGVTLTALGAVVGLVLFALLVRSIYRSTREAPPADRPLLPGRADVAKRRGEPSGRAVSANPNR
jgi:hypothetical protein